MPINNYIFGIYKVAKVHIGGSGGTAGGGYDYLLAKNISHKGSESAEPVELLQGTPKNRIFNIGAFEESYNISAPVLVGGGSKIDGRSLMNNLLNNVLTATNSLPIITDVTITINGDSGAEMSLILISDGSDLVPNTYLGITSSQAPVFIISATTEDVNAVSGTTGFLTPSIFNSR
jgi:hypothetical protein